MKSDRFVQGSVFKYPYRWRNSPDAPGHDPKDRTVCLMLKLRFEPGNTQLAIVAISDRPAKEADLSVPVPAHEKHAAGLNEFRNAYVHLGEVNFDRMENSLSFNPNAPTMGRFSKPFISGLAKSLAKNIRDRRVTRIDRD